MSLSRREFFLALKTVFGKTSVLRQRSTAVLRIYDRLEFHISRLKKRSGLKCVDGCGRCCENPRVSASVVEFLPLAVDLWARGQAEEALEILEGADHKVCVFYKPDPLVEGKGRCGIYAYRPLICRLYGFASNRDKKKNSIFVGCPMIRDHFPREYESAEKLSDDQSSDVPVMSDYGSQMSAIDPDLARQHVNINTAMKEALHKVGLQVKFHNK